MNNKQISLAARPHGEPQPSDWKLLETPVETIKDQQIAVKVEFISLDPAMRGWINEGRSYVEKGFSKVDPAIAPLERYLGVLGMPGMTAYFGLLNTGQPKEGETVVVSGAAGAVGAVVGQIAKIKGCRAIGIAGGAISQYNNTTPPKGPANYLSLLVNRARMEGIIVFDNTANYGTAASED